MYKEISNIFFFQDTVYFFVCVLAFIFPLLKEMNKNTRKIEFIMYILPHSIHYSGSLLSAFIRIIELQLRGAVSIYQQYIRPNNKSDQSWGVTVSIPIIILIWKLAIIENFLLQMLQSFTKYYCNALCFVWKFALLHSYKELFWPLV